MRGQQLVEELQSKIPETKKVFMTIGVNASTVRRGMTCIDSFKDPVIVITVGLYTSCFIIQKKNKTRYDVIEVAQDADFYPDMKFSELKGAFIRNLKHKDFIPGPLTKKLCIIRNIDDLEGDIWTETGGYYLKDQRKLNLYSLVKEIGDEIKRR